MIDYSNDTAWEADKSRQELALLIMQLAEHHLTIWFFDVKTDVVPIPWLNASSFSKGLRHLLDFIHFEQILVLLSFFVKLICFHINTT